MARGWSWAARAAALTLAGATGAWADDAIRPRTGCGAGGAGLVAIHYAPAEDLERVDVGLIGEARARLDVAAYVLTDRAIMRAIEAAAARGVTVRIVLDPSATEKDPDGTLGALAGRPNVEMRVKPDGGDLMHLKAYAVDGAILRIGSANFSRSGETRQDNELAIVRSRAEAARFGEAFERIWRSAR